MENNTINLSDAKNDIYKTKDVAKMLNTNTQTIRNYCLTFKDVLDLNHQNGQHRNFTMEDINKLKLIRHLLKEKQLTPNQVIQYLKNPKKNEGNDFNFKLLVQALSDAMLPKIEEIINKTIQSQTGDIKDTIVVKSTDINDNITKLLSNRDELKNTINQIKENQTQYISRVQKRKDKKKKQGKHMNFRKLMFWTFLVPKHPEVQKE